MLPPMDSICRAICSAERRAVPWSSILVINWVRPWFSQGFGEDAALKDGADFDEGQAVIFLDEEAQAVGKDDFLNGLVGNGGDGAGGFGRGAGGEEGVEGAAGWSQVLAGDALDCGGSDALDGGKVAFGEIEVVGGEPVAAQVLRLALHGFADGEGAGDELFDDFGQFGGGNGLFCTRWISARRASRAGMNLAASTTALMPKRPWSPGV